MKFKLRRPISLLLALCMLLACAPVLSGVASAEEAPGAERAVESISVEPLTLIENADGYYAGDWDKTTQELKNVWFCYDILPETITVNYTDGSSVTGTLEEIFQGAGTAADFTSDQSYENQWGIGTHTATATFMGVSTEYTVEITENPVESISVEPLTLIENFHGDIRRQWDETTGEYTENTWFYYEIEPKTVTVHYKDGSTVTGRPAEISEATGYHVYTNSDQSYENPWGIGTHTASAEFMGVTTEYTVEISENPVESISIDPLTLIENDNGNYEGYWDEATGEYVENAWFWYDIEPKTVTVKFKDGSAVTGTLEEIHQATGSVIQFTSDQSYENPWGVGTHTATATLMGITAEYTVEITETPVESISVEPITLTEGIDGRYEGHWDKTTGEYVENTWFRYDIEPETITIRYKDGSTFTGNRYKIYEATGYEVYFDSDQSYENQWGVGTHTATAAFMGVSTEYTVEISESPVESISVEPLMLIEKADGRSEGYWDETAGEYVENAWFRYDIEPEMITIKYKDGSTFTGHPYEISEATGFEVHFDSDQSYENPWGVGTHTATVTLMGVTAEYTVEISETPVESISVEPITLTEKVHGFYEGYWDETAGEYVENAWFRYEIAPETVTIRYKDGSTLTGKLSEISEATGYGVNSDSDQSYENQWGVGTHTATAEFMGVSTEYTVVITENPVEKIEIVKAPDKSVFLTGEYIDLKGAVLRTYYKDGTYEDLSFAWPTVGRNLYYPFHNQRLNKYFTVDLSEYHFAEPGTHKVEVSFLGMTCAYDVTVVDSTIEAITIRCDSEDSLIITAKQSDGTSFDMHVLAMDVWSRSGTGEYTAESGFLLTDRGSFSAAFCYPKDGGVFIQVVIGPENTVLQSNTLERCDWIDFNKRLEVYATLVYSLSGTTNAFEGTVTKSNIDDLITIAVATSVYSGTPVEYEERNGKIVMQGAAVKECLMQIFALADVDLSLSENYDPQTGEYLLNPDDITGESCILPIAVSRSNGVIEIRGTMLDRGSVRILLNEENNKIQAFNMDKSGIVKPVDPGTPPTGDRSLVLPIFLLLASAMALCALTCKRRGMVR